MHSPRFTGGALLSQLVIDGSPNLQPAAEGSPWIVRRLVFLVRLL
jgi:hypothetical protein